MSTDKEVLTNIKSLRKDYYKMTDEFIEEWCNLCDQINLDMFDSDEHKNNLILKHLNNMCFGDFYLTDYKFYCDIKSHDSSNMKEPTMKSDQIALLKKLEELFKNVMYKFKEWNNAYKKLKCETSYSTIAKPLLEKRDDMRFSNSLKKDTEELKHLWFDFESSPLLKNTTH